MRERPRHAAGLGHAALAGIDPTDADALMRGEHADPHRVLGAHDIPAGGPAGAVVRAFHPDAVRVELLHDGGEPVQMTPILRGGLFAAFLPGRAVPFSYRLRFRFGNGAVWERDDPYRFGPTVGPLDLHLLNEGEHREPWRVLGANVRTAAGVRGTSFAVWAPNARRVSVVGDFCSWDGRLLPMRVLGTSGVFELFVPGVGAGALYMFEIKTAAGDLRLKSDPLGRAAELAPHAASRVEESTYVWHDADWMSRRAQRELSRQAVSIYEVHLGSWVRVREEGDRFLTYREIAPRLVEHAARFGFTHVELMPVAEHPYLGSWGYQVTGYYAPTVRYGTADDLRFLVDLCHGRGLGVVLDWVPAHFPKDEFALRRFDGSALYEHEDPRRAEHPHWGTLIFNYGRREVANFLIGNALYWLRELHVDGLRVDAVSSMLYLDYGRDDGEWVPNRDGGRTNLEGVQFLRRLNRIVAAECTGAVVIAEESTAWPGVTRPVEDGGLGFAFKWNMGWMNDTLRYFARDPVHRKHHQDELTFAMLYEHSEAFVNPLSHDEVVHGKGSLLQRMPGDVWQKFANLRLLLSYQFTRPGKKLLFMGTELAPWDEWRHDRALDWSLETDPMRAGFALFLEELGALYRSRPCFWRRDPDPEGCAWIDCTDRENSVVSYERRADGEHAVVVLNLTPVPREGYRIGAPAAGRYVRAFSSDDERYGGSRWESTDAIATEPVPFHGRPQSMVLRLPPLGALVLEPA